MFISPAEIRAMIAACTLSAPDWISWPSTTAFDMAGKYELDLDYALEEKIKYNSTRNYRHGNKKA